MASKPRVLNKYKKTPEEKGVYIGRGSPWGNDFHIGRDGTRDEVCDKYEAFLMNNPNLQAKAKRALRGHNLICFCSPLRCHGDSLLRVANEESV